MEISQLNAFASKEISRIRHALKLVDPNKLALAVAVKLSEETGELSSQVLRQQGLQRKDKKQGNLDEEVADVIITSFILASATGVDVESALRNKMQKIDDRYI
jgi:NTP pyrophosphatase (non-canonical NTP hydrolase)